MDTKIQFQKDAAVMSATGKQLGTLERLVVNPESKALTDIVVRTGSMLNHEEKVVPVELISETTEEQIVLSKGAEDLKAFPPFEEERIVNERGGVSQPSLGGSSLPMPGGYPGVNMPVAEAEKERIVTRMEQNIPEGTVAMKHGAKVIAADGKSVGSVEKVLADTELVLVTHLLVARGLLTKEAKLIPVKWVMTVGEDQVHLRVSRNSVDDLSDIPLAG